MFTFSVIEFGLLLSGFVQAWAQNMVVQLCIIAGIHLRDTLLMERILHQLINSLSHYLQGFCTSQVVVWDFFHQQYFMTFYCLQGYIIIDSHIYPNKFKFLDTRSHIKNKSQRNLKANYTNLQNRPKLNKPSNPYIPTISQQCHFGQRTGLFHQIPSLGDS